MTSTAHRDHRLTSSTPIDLHGRGGANARSSNMRAWSARRSRSISGASGERRVGGRSSGPSSRQTGTATARWTSARAALEGGARRSASRPCRGAWSCGRLSGRPHRRHGPGGRARTRGTARARSSSSSRPTADVPEGIPSISSSTRAWAAGALRAPGADPRRRRRDEPPRRRGVRPRVHRAPDRALPRGDRRDLARRDAAPGEQRATLRYPEARFDAVRCGIALYGISPFGDDPADDGLEPALRWESHLAQVKRLEPGESTGYGRRSSPTGRPGSGSSRWATRTGFGAT